MTETEQLVQDLLDLRDALVEISLFLCDYQCEMNSPECRAAALQVKQLFERLHGKSGC
jgi:hypothetical protein